MPANAPREAPCIALLEHFCMLCQESKTKTTIPVVQVHNAYFAILLAQGQRIRMLVAKDLQCDAQGWSVPDREM